jgi:hypothetical protein
METEKPFGLYLYKKKNEETKVLKELLQFLRTNSRSQGHSFSYIEAETSLHPHLSLWENLQLETGSATLADIQGQLNPECAGLLGLIKEPEQKSHHSEVWERFLVSLVKGLIGPSQNLLVDMNEQLLSPFLIQKFKKSMLHATAQKTVYLASANSSLWLDCAHTIVERQEFKFHMERLDSQLLKKYWAA